MKKWAGILVVVLTLAAAVAEGASPGCDFNGNGTTCDIGDVVKVVLCNVGDISGDIGYDLNQNGINCDIGDIIKIVTCNNQDITCPIRNVEMLKIYEIFDDANTSVSSGLTETEEEELVSKMADAVTAWDSYFSTTVSKRVAIKDITLAVFFGESFISSAVENDVHKVTINYRGVISNDALAGTTLVSKDDMTLILNGYDNIRGMLIDVFVNDVGATRQEAAGSVEAILNVLAKLGAASENTSSMEEILDNWVVEWDKPECEEELMTALAPLDMDDPEKTRNMMRLVHDLNDLPDDATDDQIKEVMLRYLTEETADEALIVYNKYKNQTCTSDNYYSFNLFSGLDLNLSPSESCVSKEDIIHLLETHYEKDLPKLEAFINGIEAWVEDDANMNYLFEIYFANNAVQRALDNMKTSEANKAEIGTALDTAGVKKELFWLMINLES